MKFFKENRNDLWRSKMKIFSIALALLLFSTNAQAKGRALDGGKISKRTGLTGQMNEKENVYKVSFARGDIKSTAEGVRLIPALGSTSWAAFTRTGSHVM